MKSSLLLGLWCVPFCVFATIYKWTDENGQIQYSQSPPSNAQATIISPDASPPRDALAQQKKLQQITTQLQKAQEQKAIDTQTADEKAVYDKERQENCTRAKKYLEDLQLRPRVRLEDAQGNVKQLSEEEKNAEIQKTKENVQLYCAPQ